MKKTALLLVVLFFAPVLFAAHSDTYLIDTPTAEALPARSFGLTTRVFSGGGILSYFDFGVLNRLSIGASITVEHLIGTNEEHMKLLLPALQLKYRFYDGGEIMPAVALGFDNQGFIYNHQEDEYEQKAKGIYLALTREIFFTGFIVNGGVNYTVNGFKFDKFAGFLGAAINIKEFAAIIVEWDNIRTLDYSRLNGALRFYMTENFAIDLALRNFNNKAERIAQLKYTHSL